MDCSFFLVFGLVLRRELFAVCFSFSNFELLNYFIAILHSLLVLCYSILKLI